jgi:hypothetical protein
MLTFFRHIRKSLLGSGQARKLASSPVPSGTEGKVERYLLYAIGEIALVVIGILIALQINNWNLDRINESSVNQYLTRLLTETEMNISNVNDEMNKTRAIVGCGERILQMFHLDKSAINLNELDSLIYGSLESSELDIKTSTLQEGLNTGIQINQGGHLKESHFCLKQQNKFGKRYRKIYGNGICNKLSPISV